MSIKKETIPFEQFFKNRDSFTTSDIHAFFSQSRKDIKRSTVNWRVHQLSRNGVIKRIGRGLFSLGLKKEFSWTIDKKQKHISSLIREKFPLIQFCVWPTDILNEFTQHIAKNDLLIVEVEKEALDEVFYLLKNSKNNTFREPTTEIIHEYLPDIRNPIVVKSLPSESPLNDAESIPVPTLEKIIVDLFADSSLFFFIQGNELSQMVRNLGETYTINNNRLMRYARRRHKESDIRMVMNQIKTESKQNEIKKDNKK